MATDNGKSPIWNLVLVQCNSCGRLAQAAFRTHREGPGIMYGNGGEGIRWGQGQDLEWREHGVPLNGWLLPYASDNKAPTAFCGDCR